jgi:hypothetical protein
VALRESLLAEEQKSANDKPTASKPTTSKRSKSKEVPKIPKSPNKRATQTSTDNNESPGQSEGGKLAGESTLKPTKSKRATKPKGLKATEKRAKKVDTSEGSKSSKTPPNTNVDAAKNRGLKPKARRSLAKDNPDTDPGTVGQKISANIRGLGENASRAKLVKIIEDSDLSLSDRVKAVRSLRASLTRMLPSAGTSSHRQPTEDGRIKEGMLKKPLRNISNSGRGPKAKAPARRRVWKGHTASKPVKTGPMKVKSGFEVKTLDADELVLVPVDKPQPPVPELSYGLERVLFNPGVYQLQDPRSRVFNFDPYLAKIMPVSEFDFNALKEYITSSRDEILLATAREEGKMYTGSTSSTTAALAHFHFLLSQWRPINTGALSQSFPVPFSTFTALQRGPSAVFLRWKDGVYAIDADKQFDTANILSMLGKSMEKLLTLPTEDFEKYRKENSDQISEEQRNEAEAFNYTTIGDFLLRSQLDAYDPRLPGTGMFDLKTRAVISIRMDTKEYEQGMGYEIRGRHGEYESFEREYYDMIRAAFLKYSLQVRMGRMDGIFVAFHNTERIFGFQYISLSEMDYALHGTDDTTIGDSEFKLSLELLNRVLNKATATYPEKSLRLHFETRGSETPFMYIFAEPMEDGDIQTIQDSNKAALLEFQENILGLNGPKTEEERKNAEWQALRSKVEESMEKDELDIQEARAFAEVMLEESGYLGELSAEEKEKLMDELMATFEEGHDQGIESTAVGEIEDGEDGAEEDDEEIDASGAGAMEDSDDTEEESNDENQDDEDQAEEQDDVDQGEDSELDDEDAEAERPDSSGERDTFESEDGAKDEEDEQTDEELVEADVVKTEKLLPRAVETTPGKADDESTLHEVPHSEVDEVDSDVAKPDAKVLAMTLTIRNKVNGEYIQRPIDLSKEEKWTVEYALAEVPDSNRARLLYEATKRRRSVALSSEKKLQGSSRNHQYIEKLRGLSTKGREWRESQSKVDEAQGPPKVLNNKDSVGISCT